MAQEYVWVMSRAFGWGNTDVTEDEHEEALDRAADWLADNDLDGVQIAVRSPRSGEAEGFYQRSGSGDLQILGYSIPVPNEIDELCRKAWEHALETWPKVVEKSA